MDDRLGRRPAGRRCIAELGGIVISRLSFVFLLLAGPNCPAPAMPPQDMLASAVGLGPARAVVRTVADPRDRRIAELEAEVAVLKRRVAEPSIGEWRVFKPNPAYEVYGRVVGGVFRYSKSRLKAPTYIDASTDYER